MSIKIESQQSTVSHSPFILLRCLYLAKNPLSTIPNYILSTFYFSHNADQSKKPKAPKLNGSLTLFITQIQQSFTIETNIMKCHESMSSRAIPLDCDS